MVRKAHSEGESMKRVVLFSLSMFFALASGAGATLLTSESFALPSSGGSQGSGVTTQDMVYQSYNSTDGWGWAGGQAAVQGSSAVHGTPPNTTSVIAANEAFKFNVGSAVDTLNSTYGVGNWTIANATLSFSSSTGGYEQVNSRFGHGSGSYDIYWVANDSWVQSKGTLDPLDRELNPVYASSSGALSDWAGSLALLASAYFSDTGSGYISVSDTLALDPLFVNDILTASASGDSNMSLYIMGMSDTIGMSIFTGGQNQAVPDLRFDVVDVAPVPIPGTILLFGPGLAALVAVRKKIGGPVRLPQGALRKGSAWIEYPLFCVIPL
jgi:hypothetical protein